jgi:DNA (cytosine-5)-methyltransferase 1
MTHGSIFSGIGGFDLAAEWMGWENLFHCEWNPFGQKVLHHYWPNAEQFTDITKTDFTKYANRIDILTGGFPCQPYSHAGKRLGKEDDRHLWPEMLRAIREIQPRWVVGENVSGLISWNGGMVFDEVQADLEAEGYEVQPFVLPACAVNAPHRRDRVWFVAYSVSAGRGRGVFNETYGCNNNFNGHRPNLLQTNGTGKIKANTTTNPDSAPTEYAISTGRDVLAGNDRIATNTNRNGLNQRNGNDEKQPSEGGEYALSNAGTGNEYGDAADTSSQQGERVRPEQREFSEQEQGEFGRSSSKNGGERHATDTDGIGLRGKSDGAGKPGQFGKNGPGDYWSNFPTQPLVCSRNDGLSPELVGITVSKHRNESIKAYGNAIVPQVALQIFKAIAAM